MWTNCKNALKLAAKREGVAEFCAFLGLLLLRYFWLGVAYYPQLDDYAQYYNNTAFGQSPWQAIAQMGLLKSRPLAGVMDVTLWSSLWQHMALALVIISVLYVVSGLLFKSALQKHFAISRLFLVLYLLIPFGYEGVYWISASSRIVVGLFFAALAGWFIQKLAETSKLRFVFFWMGAQLLSFGFYEQIIVFSAAYSFFLFALNWKALKGKVAWFALTGVNGLLYVFITSLQKGFSMYNARMSIVLPWQDGFATVQRAIEGFVTTWVGSLKICWNGLQRGLPLFFTSLWIVLVAVLLVWLWQHRKVTGQRGLWLGLLMGVLLFLAPMAPFFVIENPHITLRNIVPSFVGMALIGDVVISKVVRKPVIYQGLCSLFIVLFIIISLSETKDYQYNHTQDQLLAQTLTPYVSKTEKIAILNLRPYWDEEQNWMHSDHVLSNAASDWALLGLMRNVLNDNKIKPIMPITVPMTWGGWNREARQLCNFDKVYYYKQGSLTELTYKQTGEFDYDLYQDGQKVGRIIDTEGDGKLELYEEIT